MPWGSGKTPGSWSVARNVVKNAKNVLGDAWLDARVRRLSQKTGGDEEETQVLKQRMHHRQDPGVRDCLHRWWLTAQNTFREADGGPSFQSVRRAKVGRAAGSQWDGCITCH